MGSCFSSSFIETTPSTTRTIKLVALDGSLREYSSEVKVYEALGRDHPSCFICDSDELHFDRKIVAMASQASLQLGQLYFALPVSKLEVVVTGADMAALAVKASGAIEAAAVGKRKSKCRRVVMPVMEESVHGLERSLSSDFEKKRKERMVVVKGGVGVGRLKRERLSAIQEFD